jgi:hypothetical protein
MRRRVYTITFVFLAAVLGYETGFRVCTAKWGEVDMHSKPPRVFYSADLNLPLPLLRWIFGIRTYLPLGIARLSKGSGAGVDGGRIYRHLPDGTWHDITDALIEYQNKKSYP